MSRKNSRIILYLLLIALAVFVLANGPERLLSRGESASAPGVAARSPLEPTIARRMAVRFDPSYYYRGERPSEIAAELAETWRRSGLNTVFFRAYDPRHGAFYQTSYDGHPAGEFGRFDLLKHVLDQCHEREIEVFAWMPVLNVGRAWEENPAWRAKNAEGLDHSETGLEFPLCARNPEVRQWWSGLVRDFLERYPRIDGVDFGEPVVSWRENAACWCPLCRAAIAQSGPDSRGPRRAQPLSELLRESISLVHQAGKLASVTSVQTAGPTGALWPADRMRDATGFDLMALLNAPGDEAPDIVCPEFIWQEMHSRYSARSPAGGAPEFVFTPEWTESAVREFIGRLDVPVEIIAHVEITDFPDALVGGSELRASIRAALRGGAAGIDVYSSSQLDGKSAWSALRGHRNTVARKRCLVLYDQNNGESDGTQTGEMLRHFNVEVDLTPIDQYAPGALDQYDNVFYVGVDSTAVLPEAFLTDLADTRAVVCWLGFNVDQALARPAIAGKLGLAFTANEQDSFDRVVYKQTVLPKEDPWTCVLEARDPARCRTFAVAGNGEREIPYAIRSGRRFWFFADVPSSYAIEGGRYLVFADLLHDILNEDHAENPLAMVRIEDVHPLSDPAALDRIATFLHDADVAFQMAVVPIYAFPEENAYARLREKPNLASALKRVAAKGGAIVMHGTTHQRFGETTSDYEFWDPVGDHPPEDSNEQSYRARIEEGLYEFWSSGVFPLAWETPHYAGSQEFYRTVSSFFSAAMERRQSVDTTGSDQAFPYLIRPDRFGQIIVPENLAYVPLNDQRPEVILGPARNMKVVRDGVASFFFHPFLDLQVLKDIVNGMKSEEFRFVGIAGLPLRTEASFGVTTNTHGAVRLAGLGQHGQELALNDTGRIISKRKVVPNVNGEFRKAVSPPAKRIYAVHFRDDNWDDSARNFTDAQSASNSDDALQTVPNFLGERCRVPRPLLLTNHAAPPSERGEIQAFISTFGLVGIDVLSQDIRDFSAIPSQANLLVVPAGAAALLSETQCATIIDAVRQGRADAIASGFSKLSEYLEIERLDRRVVTQRAADIYYEGMEIAWEPPVETQAFASPANAVTFYENCETGAPLMVASELGEGRYIFMSAPLGGRESHTMGRYPYFMAHVLRFFGHFPLVRSSGIDVYFDPADREGIAIEDLVKQWRRAGVRAIYAAAWQVFPDWTYDYERLIQLAHNNAMRVHAWCEPPYVNEKFWIDHPQWREKNALDEDASSGVRKPMAAGDPACLDAIKEETRRMLQRFDWDGVVLNSLGWESNGGFDNPRELTPFHPSVRERFRRESGFDPAELAHANSPRYWKSNPRGLEQFEDFRASLAQSWTEELLAELADLRRGKSNGWEILLAFNPQHGQRGISRENLVDWKARFQCRLMALSSPGRPWGDLLDIADAAEIDIESGPSNIYFEGRAYPTGLPLYANLNAALKRSPRIALRSESSLFEIDLKMLPFILSADTHETWRDGRLEIDSPRSSEIHFYKLSPENLLLDRRSPASRAQSHLSIPAGTHTVSLNTRLTGLSRALAAKARIVDFSGNLLDASVTSRGLRASYDEKHRAIFVIDERPRAIRLDGASLDAAPEKGMRGWTVCLPAGKHTVAFVTRSWTDLVLSWSSIILSNGIVAISFSALAAFAVIILVVRRRRRRQPSDG
jgi:uncharacterized protein YdaL